MADLSKLGIGLSVVFILSFLALLIELCYIFCRRKKQNLSHESDISGERCMCSVFQLFRCLKKSGIERNRAPTTIHPVEDSNESEEVDDELTKWQEIYGPSRVLFTIKEEEKEDLESEKSCSERKSKKLVCLAQEEEMVMVMLGLEGETETETETPYYTPASSPARDYVVEVEESEKKCFPVTLKKGGGGG